MKTTFGFTCLALLPLSGAATFDHPPAGRDALSAAPSLALVRADDRTSSDCDGHTIGFWSNPNGQELIEAGGFLSVLPHLHVVDENGVPFTTDDFEEFKEWLLGANAVNMAYMLSVQLVAMQFNILAGFVDEDCQITHDGRNDAIVRITSQAIKSLINDPYTPVGDPNRPRQEFLKDLLDAANNNLIWH